MSNFVYTCQIEEEEGRHSHRQNHQPHTTNRLPPPSDCGNQKKQNRILFRLRKLYTHCASISGRNKLENKKHRLGTTHTHVTAVSKQLFVLRSKHSAAAAAQVCWRWCVLCERQIDSSFVPARAHAVHGRIQMQTAAYRQTAAQRFLLSLFRMRHDTPAA